MPYYRFSGEAERKGNKWQDKTKPFKAANRKAALRKLPRLLAKLNDTKNSFLPDALEQIARSKKKGGGFAIKKSWPLERFLGYRIK